jgi:hypothetical protein
VPGFSELTLYLDKLITLSLVCLFYQLTAPRFKQFWKEESIFKKNLVLPTTKVTMMIGDGSMV